MKKILLIVAFIAGTVSTSMSQGKPGGTPEERVQRNPDELKKSSTINGRSGTKD